MSELDFSKCPKCECKHFYHQKDFNRAIGCLMILAGAILVPFTYGLSLAVVAAMDWYLYKKVSDEVVCYKCREKFNNVDIPEHITPFDHHIAELYEEPD